MSSSNTVSIIVPVYKEGCELTINLRSLLRVHNLKELIVVDASANTINESEINQAKTKFCDQKLKVVESNRSGRAYQMNLGARHATGEILLFLHADTLLPKGAITMIEEAATACRWGRFNVRLDADEIIFRLIERFMNWRSKFTSIATGDQAIFVHRLEFESMNGFADIPLMEDVEISRRLKRFSRPYIINNPVITSARRWQQNGIYKTILLMWSLRFLYWIGVHPKQLDKWYHRSAEKLG